MTDLIETAITEYFGERCDDYEERCVVCRAWKEYDNLVALADRATWTNQKKYEHDLRLKKDNDND
jgi:hypothetical protein